MLKFTENTIVPRLLDLIDRCKNIDSNGKASFTDPRIQLWEVLLGGLVGFSRDVPEIERKKIVWLSLVAAAEQGSVNSNSFLEEASNRQSKYLSLRPKRHILYTTISIMHNIELPGVRLGNASISFPSAIPKRFRGNRRRVEEWATPSLLAEPPDTYRWVRVSTKARSIDAAAPICLESLNLLRGLWNLALNLGKEPLITTGGPRQPINSIVLGPIHSVHLESGRIERDVWWYEPEYVGPIRLADLRGQKQEIQKYQRAMRYRLSRIPYQDDVEQMIRLYSGALDYRDWSASFIRLWQVLEAVTLTAGGSRKSDSLKTTIKRAAFVNTEADFHHALLDMLRQVRNRLIHSGTDTSEIAYYLYRLKTYVENLILFHLGTGGGFSNRGDAVEFLELPSSRDEINRRISVLRKGLAYRKED